LYLNIVKLLITQITVKQNKKGSDDQKRTQIDDLYCLLAERQINQSALSSR